MSYLDNPILVDARKADLRLLSEKKIDAKIEKILDAERNNHRKSFSDYKYETITNKSIFGYITKSARSLLSLMNALSKTKKSGSADDAKLSVIIEQNKILASLIIQQKLNSKQINEMIGDSHT